MEIITRTTEKIFNIPVVNVKLFFDLDMKKTTAKIKSSQNKINSGELRMASATKWLFFKKIIMCPKEKNMK